MKAAGKPKPRELNYADRRQLDQCRAAAAVLQVALLKLLGLPGNAFGPRIAGLLVDAETVLRNPDQPP